MPTTTIEIITAPYFYYIDLGNISDGVDITKNCVCWSGILLETLQ